MPAAASGPAGARGFSGIAISPDLNCEGDVDGYGSPSQFYGGVACGTFLFVDGVIYGPARIPAGPSVTPWTPVSQTSSGSATPTDPLKVVTVVTAADTGVQVTETDTFVAGSPVWSVTVDLANTVGHSVSRLTTARDCYVADSDAGIGQVDTALATTFCEGASAALALTPGVAGATYVEAGYSDVWAMATQDSDLPNSVDASYRDNGQAASWAVTNGRTSFSWKNIFVTGPSAAESGSSPNPSIPPTTCSSAQPVNCATGDFWHTFVDAATPSRGLPLQVERTYDLVNAGVQGAFGYGWSSSLDMALTQTSSTQMTLQQENGSLLSFTLGDAGWEAPRYANVSLTQTSSGWAVTRTTTGLTYAFDLALHLVSVRDIAGEAISIVRDGTGQVSSISDAGAGTIRVTWSGGRVGSITDAAGAVTSYAYDASGDLRTVTLPGGGTWAFTYAAHRLVQMTDPVGHSTINTYDASYRVVSQVQPSGGTVTYTYAGDPASVAGSTTTQVDERGVTTTYSFSNMLLLQRTTDGGVGARTVSYTYDLVSLGLSRVVDDGLSRSSAYDSLGRVVTATDARGFTTSYTYDSSSSRITSVVSPEGRTSSMTYDGLGRLTSTSDGLTSRTYAYADPQHPGDVTSSTQGDRVTSFTHDALGDVTLATVTSPSGTVVQTAATYDADGRVVCAVRPSAYSTGTRCAATGHAIGTTTTTYDAAGNPITVVGPDGGTTHKSYDASNSLVSSQDPSGSTTRLSYDGYGRVTQATRAAGTPQSSTTTTTYDVPAGTASCPTDFGTVSCAVESDGAKTTLTGYDASGDVVSTVRPGGGVAGLYRSAGLVRQAVREDGTATYFGYDGDLLTSRTSTTSGSGATALASASGLGTDTAAATFAYDRDGRRTVMDDGTGETVWEYDTAGDLTAETTPQGTVRATRDDMGDLAVLTYPDGSSVQRRYDAAGRVTSVTDWSGRTTAVAVSDDGSITTTTLPNGRSIGATYDASGGLSALSVPGLGIGLTYRRDSLQRVTQESATGLPGTSTTFAYDALRQLASVNGLETSSDPSGNPTHVSGVPQTFDAALALVTHDQDTYSSDSVGDRVSQELSTGMRSQFGYDVASHLTRQLDVTGPAASALSVSSGPSLGGTTVDVVGSNFSPDAVIAFGSTVASTTWVSATVLRAVSPPGSGSVPVTVRSAAGQSRPSAALTYTYLQPAVTSLSMRQGLSSGGQQLTVSGWNLGGATSVQLGSALATFTVVSPTTLSVTTPPGSGVQHLTVTTPQGTSTATPSDTFEFVSRPVISTVSPAAGPPGTVVTITGSNLSGATTVTFGGVAGTRVTVVSTTTLRVTAPSSGSGTVNVAASSPQGTSVPSAVGSFSYATGPRVLQLSPTTAKAAGGTVVSVKGAGFTTGSSATVGGIAVPVTFVSSTALKVTVPGDSTALTATVVVTTGQQSSPPIPQASVTYLRPVLSGLSTTVGPSAGHELVTIAGTALSGATAVTFGTTSVRPTSVTATSLVVATPRGQGTVDVTVRTPQGTSLIVPAGRFSFTTTPIVTEAITDLGDGVVSPRGDTSLTLTGYTLSAVTSVTVGSTAGVITAKTATSLTVMVPATTGPPGVAGVTSVTVRTRQGTALASAPLRVVYAARDDRWRYDGLGRLATLTQTDGTVVPTVWDPFASDPTPLIHGAWRLVTAAGSLPVEQVDGNDAAYYPVLDARGSPRALLDGAGSVVSTYGYGPYGQVIDRTGTVAPVLGFGGGLVEPSGLVRLGARVLDTVTGTFLTVDPAVALTGSPYAYAAGDPYNASDRQGLWPTIVIGAVIGAVVGAAVSTVSYALSPGDHDLRGYLGAAAGGGLSGGITGACLGTGVGLLASAACGTAGGAAGSAVDQLISRGSIDLAEVGVQAAFGAAVGGVGGLLSKKLGLELTKGQIRSYGNLVNSDKWLPGRIRSNYWQNSWLGGLIDGPRSVIYSYLKCYA